MRRYLFFAAIGIVLVSAIVTIWRSTHTGSVNITTDNKVYHIKLSAVHGRQKFIDNGPIKEGEGSLAARVPVGSYAVQIENPRIIVASTILTVKHGKTASYNFKTTDVNAAEPVAAASAQSLAVDEKHLVYLDSATKKVVRIDAPNSLNQAYVPQPFQNLKWLNPNYGIGLGLNGGLYEINSGALRQLTIAGETSPIIQYDLNSNKQIYVLAGSTIYSGPAGSLHKLGLIDNGPVKLVATTNYLALIHSGHAGENPSTPAVEIVDSSGKITKSIIEANDGVWSPDSRQLLLINSDDTSAIYDISLRQKAILPTKNISAAIWLSNDSLLYSAGHTLYSYSSKTVASNAVALTDGDIHTLNLDSQRVYAYISSGSSDSAKISRYNLKKQPVDQLSYKLGSFLPDSVATCSISYINLTQPTVLLFPYNPATIDACQRESRSRLQAYGLDLSRLQFIVGPIFAGTD
jgi:hypothetical protein